MSTPLRHALRGQLVHAVIIAIIGALLSVAADELGGGPGRAWGMTTEQAVIGSWVFAALMQAWIAFGWRAELHFGKFSTWFGDGAFTVFRVGFLALALPRLALIIPIAQSTRGTLSWPIEVRIALIVVTTPFILWGAASYLRYFGINRIFGADHFDPSYRGTDLVVGGLFKYVRNVGYAVILLLIYHPALVFDSLLGMVVGAAHHALVWTAYFCTEKPDMKEIYGV